MSAYVCNTETFDALLTCLNQVSAQHRDFYVPNLPPLHNGTTYNLGDTDDLTKLGQILLAANVDSVLYRYPQDKPDEHDSKYRFRRYDKPVPVLTALKLISCIDYQSCELPEWETTPAKRILTRMMEKLVMHLPGWEAAPWGIVR